MPVQNYAVLEMTRKKFFLTLPGLWVITVSHLDPNFWVGQWVSQGGHDRPTDAVTRC